jgi:hypothetical protein
LQFNHNAIQRRRRKKETVERAKSTPSFDQLVGKALDIGTVMDPNFEANRREIMKARHKRNRIQQILAEEPDAPPGVNPEQFYEILDFVNRKFATRKGSGLWTELGYLEFFDACSFRRSSLYDADEIPPPKDSDTICANEWVTMLTSLGFGRSHAELLELHRDLGDHGVLTRKKFASFAPVGCFLFDCKTYGVHQARIQQITRKQGYKPAAPQSVEDSVYDMVHGSGEDGAKSAFSMFMDKEKDAVATKLTFIEDQKAETRRRRTASQAKVSSDTFISSDPPEGERTATPVHQLQESATFSRKVKGSQIIASVDMFKD